jgi:hypothetical protein
VDFLIHRGGRFELMDAKWSKAPTPRDAQPMIEVAELIGQERVSAQRLICRCEEPFPVSRARAINLDGPLFDGDPYPPPRD